MLLLVALGYLLRGPGGGRAGYGGRPLPPRRRRKPRSGEAGPPPSPGQPRENSPSPDMRAVPSQAIELRLQAVERRNVGSLYFEAHNGNSQGAGGRHHQRSPSPKGRGGGGGRIPGRSLLVSPAASTALTFGFIETLHVVYIHLICFATGGKVLGLC